MSATTTGLDFYQRRQLQAKENPVSDEELLLEYSRTGDRELFAQLVYRYERELYSYLRRYLGDAQLAEDVFQATFLQVHRKCDQYEEGRRFRPWLYTIATNQAIDARRRTKRHKMVSLDRPGGAGGEEASHLAALLASDAADPADTALRLERTQRMRQSLDQLPEPMVAVIHLVYFQGLKYREAAQVLDIPVGTVKSRLHAAIAKLTDVWNETNP